MGEPKRQHYVPSSYLAGFCREDGRLWLRDGEKRENRSDRPENAAIIRHYYSVDKDGQRDNAIEKGLGDLESTAMPLITDLSEGRNLNNEGKDNLSLYVAFQWLRVPDFQRGVEKMGEHLVRRTMNMMFRDVEDVKKSLEDFTAKTGQVMEVPPERLLELFQGDGLNVDIKRILSLEMMVKQAEPMANIFRQMDWIILHADGGCSFVTSDNPLILEPPKNFPRNSWYGYGIATRGCRKIFPLTQSACLMMLDRGDRIGHLKAAKMDIRNINRNIANHVTRYLFGRDEALINSMAPIVDTAAHNRDGRLTIN